MRLVHFIFFLLLFDHLFSHIITHYHQILFLFNLVLYTSPHITNPSSTTMRCIFLSVGGAMRFHRTLNLSSYLLHPTSSFWCQIFFLTPLNHLFQLSIHLIHALFQRRYIQHPSIHLHSYVKLISHFVLGCLPSHISYLSTSTSTIHHP